jgi:hypothetical protein
VLYATSYLTNYPEFAIDFAHRRIEATKHTGHLKLAGLALAPVGKTIVTKETAEAARP